MIPESTIQVPVNSSNGLGWSISHSFSVWFSIEIEVDSLTSALSIDGFALKVKKKQFEISGCSIKSRTKHLIPESENTYLN